MRGSGARYEMKYPTHEQMVEKISAWSVAKSASKAIGDSLSKQQNVDNPTCAFESVHSGGYLETVWRLIIQTVSRLSQSVQIFTPTF